MSRISKVTVFLREVLIPAEVQVVSLLNAYRLLAGRPAASSHCTFGISNRLNFSTLDWNALGQQG